MLPCVADRAGIDIVAKLLPFCGQTFGDLLYCLMRGTYDPRAASFRNNGGASDHCTSGCWRDHWHELLENPSASCLVWGISAVGPEGRALAAARSSDAAAARMKQVPQQADLHTRAALVGVSAAQALATGATCFWALVKHSGCGGKLQTGICAAVYSEGRQVAEHQLVKTFWGTGHTQAGLEVELGAAKAPRRDVKRRYAIERLPRAQPLRAAQPYSATGISIK